MPYVTPEIREVLEESVNLSDLGAGAAEPGELNYVITRVVLGYMKQHGLCYDTINDIVGVLHSVCDEFQRRVVGPYEDVKILQNGDVY